MNNKAIVAVIGLGNIALRHRRNLKQIFPDAEVIAMSSSGRAITDAIEFADDSVSDLATLILKKPYFVIVASPSSHHQQHAAALIEAGIPVLIEKPVTSNVSDARKLILLEQTNDTPIAVAYCLRYLPSAQQVKKVLESGQLGVIYNVHAEVGQYLPDWRPNKDLMASVSANPELGGGVLLELSHELDYLHWLLGDFSLEYACLRNSRELNLAVEEIADITLRNQQGTVCQIHLDFLQKMPYRQCHVIGSKARLIWDVINNTVTVFSAQGQEVIYAEPKWDKNLMYISMIEDFINLLNQQKNQCIDLQQALKTVELIDQIKQRAITGKQQ